MNGGKAGIRGAGIRGQVVGDDRYCPLHQVCRPCQDVITVLLLELTLKIEEIRRHLNEDERQGQELVRSAEGGDVLFGAGKLLLG